MNEYDGELPTPDQAFSTALNRLLDLDRSDPDRSDLDRSDPDRSSLAVPGPPGPWDRLRTDRRPFARHGPLSPACLDPRIDDLVRRVADGVYAPPAPPTGSGGTPHFWAPEEDPAARPLIPSPLIPRQRGSSTGRREVLPPRDTGEPDVAPVTVSVPPPAGRVIPPVRVGHCSAGQIPCGVTGARLYPGGWFCDSHRP